MMIDKQKQSLKYSYETLGNLLSAAENFAGLRGEQYHEYDISSSHNYNGLKGEFAWELECFKLAIDNYQKSYGPYQFPPDCPKEKILKDIKRYMQKMDNTNDKNLYILMADIINGKKVNMDFQKLYQELDKNANNKFNPKKLKDIVGPLNQILDQSEKEAENGNMDLLGRNNTKKSREQLKKMEDEKSKKITVFLGEKGKLYVSNNGLVVMEDLNQLKQQIDINPEDIRRNTFYMSNRGIVLITEFSDSYVSCILFRPEKKKEINEDKIIKKATINFNDKMYYYGITFLEGKDYEVLVQSEEEYK